MKNVLEFDIIRKIEYRKIQKTIFKKSELKGGF